MTWLLCKEYDVCYLSGFGPTISINLGRLLSIEDQDHSLLMKRLSHFVYLWMQSQDKIGVGGGVRRIEFNGFAIGGFRLRRSVSGLHR